MLWIGKSAYDINFHASSTELSQWQKPICTTIPGYTFALFTNLAASADTNKNLSILLDEITYSTYEDITCYNCTAKDSWCFYINDLIKA